MKKKKVLPLCLAALLCVSTFGVTKTNAADSTNFNIQTASSWGEEVDPSAKEASNLIGYVNWTRSNQSSHKEWFRLVNSNGALRSYEKLFSYKTSGNLTELETQVGYYYYLQAKREHLGNPKTTVEGTFYS